MSGWLRRFAWSWLVLIPATLVFLAATEPGLRCLISVGNRLSGGLFTIGSASGTLWGPLHLGDLRYADGIDTVLIDTVDISWDPSQLLNRQIRIQTIHAVGIRVILGESPGETLLAPFALPGRLVIETILAEQTTVLSNQEEIWHVEKGTLTNLRYQGPILEIDSLVLNSGQSTIRAQGQLLTENEYPLRYTVETQAQPAGYQPIVAHGTLTGPLNGLKLEATLESPLAAQLRGRIDKLLGETTWEARVESPVIALPAIHRDWPNQGFSQMVIDGRGSLEEYVLNIRSSTELPGAKEPTALAAEIYGDFNGFLVPSLHLTHGKASLAAQGRLTWTPTLSWQASVDGAHLDPSLVIAEWPGDLACRLTTEGEIQEEGIKASFFLPELGGTLRRLPFTAKGEASLANNQLHIPQFLLTSAGSSLRLQGKAAETIELDLRLQSPNLAELWPNARGKVDLRGRLSGQPAKPEIDLHLTGSRVGLGTDGIDTLNIDTKGTLATEGRIFGTARANHARFGTMHWDQGQLQLQGSLKDHSVTLEARSKERSVAVTFIGAMVKHKWLGSIRQASYIDSQLGAWKQRQPTPLAVSPEQLELKDFCLDDTTSSAGLCLDGSWLAASKNWQVQAALNAFPVDTLGEAGHIPWPVEGLLNANLDLAGQHNRILTGKLHVYGTGMTIRPPLKDSSLQRLQWQKNDLRAEYSSGQLRLILDSVLTDDSSLHADFTQANPNLSVTGLLRNPVHGKVHLLIRDLSPVALLTNQAVIPSGMLQGHYAISGQPRSPLITGQMELTNGQAEIPPLGITLAPLQMSLQGDAANIRLQATAHSGSGSLQATSTINIHQSGNNMVAVHLTGEDFKTARLPGIDLDISPDLHIRVHKKQTEIRGDVTIPQARITSVDFGQATPISSDVVIIDDDEPAAINTDLPLIASVNLIAGDDVHVDAFGLRGVITGKLHVLSRPGRPPVGNGTLTVKNGSFTVYGRRLKIDLGRLLFTGGPLTNPGVELRSEHKTDKVTTGVIVEGFLKKPEISFYSSPAMEQAAIVAHLLETTAIGGETRDDIGFVGKLADTIGLDGFVPYLRGVKQLSMIDEIKVETGDDYDEFSLVFGSWLTPDFYVSYGKDMIKESGTFNTRYTLGKGFFFLTETGASQSGGDIKYVFEF